MADTVCPPAKTTILIAVAVRLYRDGLAATLGADNRIDVRATACTSREAVALARSVQPQVALIDVSLDDALNLICAMREECPATRILVFAVREDLTTILEYASAGADGFVTSNGTVADLVSAIERTSKGELLCSPRMAAELLRQAARRSASVEGPPVSELTTREEQVFSLLRQGRTNKEIGASLCIAEATVKNHVHHVLEKLRVTTRGRAAASAFRPAKGKFEEHVTRRRTG